MSEFKEMKFWIGSDPELSKRIQGILFALGYGWSVEGVDINYTDGLAIYTTDGGDMNYSSRTNRVGRVDFKAEPEEEIDISWMRTAKPETVELGGKTYIKSELEEALSHIKPLSDTGAGK